MAQVPIAPRIELKSCFKLDQSVRAWWNGQGPDAERVNTVDMCVLTPSCPPSNVAVADHPIIARRRRREE